MNICIKNTIRFINFVLYNFMNSVLDTYNGSPK